MLHWHPSSEFQCLHFYTYQLTFESPAEVCLSKLLKDDKQKFGINFQLSSMKEVGLSVFDLLNGENMVHKGHDIANVCRFVS